ncbi:hypothetical protein CsSME_00006678 [Camellia sinensis var. sinensis]
MASRVPTEALIPCKVKQHLFRTFEMKDLGPLRYFLGIEVAFSPKGYFLSQVKYANKVIHCAGLTDTKLFDTPIELNVKLNTTDGVPLPSFWTKLSARLTQKDYRCYDPVSCRLYVSHYIAFLERLSFFQLASLITPVFKEDLIHIDPFPSEVPSAKYISTVPPALVSSSPPASPLVSLWNDPVTNIGQELLDISDKFPIVAIKSLKVGDFQGNLECLDRCIFVGFEQEHCSGKSRHSRIEKVEILLRKIIVILHIGMIVKVNPATNNGMRSMYSDRVPLPHITHNPSLGEEKKY